MKRRSKEQADSIIESRLYQHKLQWFEIISIALGLFYIFYPEPNKYIFCTLVSLPIVGILLNSRNKPSLASLVHIKMARGGEDSYWLAAFIAAVPWFVIIKFYLSYQVVNPLQIIAPALLVLIIVISILLLTHKLVGITTKKNKYWVYSLLIIHIILYSYSVALTANCLFDNSKPIKISTTIQGKKIKKSKISNKVVCVKVLLPEFNSDTMDISFPSYKFDELIVGNEIQIESFEGLFKMNWLPKMQL